MEQKKTDFLTDNEGNPSSLRKVFYKFFWVTMLILVGMIGAEIYSAISAGESYKANVLLILILLCMLFFPKLAQKIIELKFPGIGNAK